MLQDDVVKNATWSCFPMQPALIILELNGRGNCSVMTTAGNEDTSCRHYNGLIEIGGNS
jgi:hypothetical protein